MEAKGGREGGRKALRCGETVGVTESRSAHETVFFFFSPGTIRRLMLPQKRSEEDVMRGASKQALLARVVDGLATLKD